MLKEIYQIEVQHRGEERNWFNITNFNTLKDMPVNLPEKSFTDLSETFNNEFIKRLQKYLIDGDEIIYESHPATHKLYPLDTIFRAYLPSCYNEGITEYDEMLQTIEHGIVIVDGFVSDMIDCHLKTILIEIAKQRPNNVIVSFTIPDVLLPSSQGDKALYSFFDMGLRKSYLQTEMAVMVKAL